MSGAHSASAEPTSCKVVFGSHGSGSQAPHDVRRFKLQPGGGFAYLEDKLKAAYPEAGELTIKYVDDEGDYVTIGDDEDYEVALSLCTESIFRVFVSESPAMPQTQEAPFTRTTETVQPDFPLLKRLVTKHPNSLKAQLLKQVWKDAKPGNPRKALARFVSHVTIPDGFRARSGEVYTKIWRVRNDSKWPWPPRGLALQFVSGNTAGSFQCDEVTPITLGGILPGQEADISINFTSPTARGAYQGFWRLQGPFGNKFGQRLGCSILVVGDKDPGDSSSPGWKSNELSDDFVEVLREDSAFENKVKENKVDTQYTSELARLKDLGFSNTEECAKLLNKFNGDFERTVSKLGKLAQKSRNKEEKEQAKAGNGV